jgi:hypothetical protein
MHPSSTKCRLTIRTSMQVQLGLFYSFVTTAHFEDDTHILPPTTTSTSATSSPQPAARLSLLKPDDLARAHVLQEKLLEAFSPILFQSPPASHMECTDAIADAWLSLVIPSAMATSAPDLGTAAAKEDEAARLSRDLDLGRPLESLRALEAVDWEAKGVCKECAEGRRRECREEREAVWEKLPAWLGFGP